MLMRYFVCFLVLLMSNNIIAQLPATSEARVLLRYENSYYIKFHSQGWGIGYRTGANQTALRKRMLEIGFFTMKHPKEVRISNVYTDIVARSYIYGKMNHFFLLQASVGTQRILNEKPFWGGIEVRSFISAGPVLGFTKPIYLYIFPYKTLEKYDPEEHFYDNIYGRGPFLKGFDEIRFHPGVFVKAGFNFEHGAEEKRLSSLEAGAMVSAFVKPVEIMSFTKNYRIFLSLYISYHLGNRKN